MITILEEFMKNNSFKAFENQIISDRKDNGASTKENVQATIGLFRLIGDIVELYGPNIPKVLSGITTKQKYQQPDDNNTSSKNE